jgi:hypothetical protein
VRAGEVEYGDQQLQHALGLSCDDLSSVAAWRERIIPADRQRIIATMARAMEWKRGGLYDYRYSIAGPGGLRHMHSRGQVYFSNKEPIEFVG